MKFVPTIQNAWPWATSGLYPAVPASLWAGQPQKVTPVADTLTPGEHPAAEELNFLIHDRFVRLSEAKDDIRATQRAFEVASLKNYTRRTGIDDARGLAVTDKDKAFLSTGGRIYQVAPSGLLSVNLPPGGTGNVYALGAAANGEKVLFGHSPAGGYIYDADTDTYTATSVGSGTLYMLEAAKCGTGWVTLWCNATAGAGVGGYSANVSGPRTYAKTGTCGFQLRTVSDTGVVGSDTSTALWQGILSAVTAGQPCRVALVRMGNDYQYFALASAVVGSVRAACYSGDSGATWTNRTLPDPYSGAAATLWQVEWDAYTEQLVLTVTKILETKVYHSTDFGANWTDVATFTADATHPGKGCFAPLDLRATPSGMLVAVSNPITDVGGTTRWPIHVSSDAGLTWHMTGLVDKTGAAGNILALCGDRTPVQLAAGQTNALYHFDSPAFAFGAR